MKRWLPSSDVTRVIREAREELSPYLARLDIERLSQHNRGYMRYSLDSTRSFIDQEIIRYVKTVDFINETLPRDASVIDIGLFVPVVPIALAKLGFQVASVDKLAFYGGALNEMISLISDHYNVSIYDLDILNDDLDVLAARYDVVLLLAILEHLNGTPRYLLERVKILLKTDGYIVVEVPNASSLRKRIAFLVKGAPPYPPFPDYYHSDYPFTGHNREYTVRDLKYALEHSGLEIIRMEVFHHSTPDGLSLKAGLWRFLERIGPADWKPNIWAVTQVR